MDIVCYDRMCPKLFLLSYFAMRNASNLYRHQIQDPKHKSQVDIPKCWVRSGMNGFLFVQIYLSVCYVEDVRHFYAIPRAT